MSASVAPIDPDRARLREPRGRILRRIHLPRPRLRGSDWADAHWQLSREAGAIEPGQWRTARAPYLREILDTLTDPGVQRVVWMKASQVGASELGHIWFAYTVNLTPAPFIILYPTETALKNWSTLKLEPAIRANPSLAGKLVDVGGRRDSRNTMTRKTYAGGGLVALAAKSTAQLRSLTAFFAIAEEVDEYDADVRKQGDPLELLERAVRNALRAGGKIYIPSTPTEKSFSNIEREFNGSDQRYFYVPCPQCNGMQRLHWQDAQGRFRILFDRNADDSFIRESARYLCEYCAYLIEERWKDAMLGAGVWRPTYPGRSYPGFQLGAQYSPFVSWWMMMDKWVGARRSPAKRKTFWNLWVGEPYEDKGEAIKTHELSARAEPYGDGVDVPHGVGIVTAGVDVQGDRLEVFPWGFGHLEESWCLGWEVLDGDPGQDAVWAALWERLTTPYRHASGAPVQIAAVAVDAGHNIERVVRFCDAARARGRMAIPIVGRAGRGKPLLQAPDPQKWKKTRRQSRPVYTVHVDAGKDLFFGRLRIQEPGPEYVHFPDGIDPTYYDQMTAERLVTTYTKGRPAKEWQLIPDRRNEALDGTIYALAALMHLGPLVRRQLAARAKALTEYVPQTAPVTPAGQASPPYGIQSEVLW